MLRSLGRCCLENVDLLVAAGGAVEVLSVCLLPTVWVVCCLCFRGDGSNQYNIQSHGVWLTFLVTKLKIQLFEYSSERHSFCRAPQHSKRSLDTNWRSEKANQIRERAPPPLVTILVQHVLSNNCPNYKPKADSDSGM
jgi:hypothetical protein